MTSKKARSTETFSTLDDWLEEEGVKDEFQAIGIKETLACQSAKVMKAQKLCCQHQGGAHAHEPQLHRTIARSRPTAK